MEKLNGLEDTKPGFTPSLYEEYLSQTYEKAAKYLDGENAEVPLNSPKVEPKVKQESGKSKEILRLHTNLIEGLEAFCAQPEMGVVVNVLVSVLEKLDLFTSQKIYLCNEEVLIQADDISEKKDLEKLLCCSKEKCEVSDDEAKLIIEALKTSEIVSDGKLFCLALKDKKKLDLKAIIIVESKAIVKADWVKEIIAIVGCTLLAWTQNATLFSNQKKTEERFYAMIDIIQALHSDLGINSILFTISNRTHKLVEADRCSVFLYDKQQNEMSSLQGEVDVRFSASDSIAGECCMKNDVIVIDDAYQDPRFNPEIDKATNFRTQTMLSVPIRDSNKQVLGALQLINKHRDQTFTEKDVELVEYFLSVAGPLLGQSPLYQQQTRRKSTHDPKGLIEGREMGLGTRKNSLDGIEIPPAVLEDDGEASED